MEGRGRALSSGAAKGYPLATFAAAPRPGYFSDRTPSPPRSAARDQIVNALGPQFHKGLEPSRYGRPGRIPGSVNVPAASLVAANKTFATLADAAAQIRRAKAWPRTSPSFAIAAEAFRRPLTFSCCTSWATTSCRSMTGRWASGRATPRCRSKRIDRPAYLGQRGHAGARAHVHTGCPSFGSFCRKEGAGFTFRRLRISNSASPSRIRPSRVRQPCIAVRLVETLRGDIETADA